ncbi:rodlin [Streptomyces sp. CBMA152]|uniref:rodlin n=1 Tax=Streptomyces sp. CBMA152 TaxID=1896312 RepID=UPI001660B985|nr:rodlin [Streptomyces sp. CBMA152]MBD0744967.1 RdlA protein [Streptomyces sp. CBMA152]
MQKLWSVAAVAAAVSGATVMVAPQALAIGNDGGTTSFSGNDAEQKFGNSVTKGNMSPQLGVIQGTLNKACFGVPAKLNVGSVVGWVPVTVLQDVPVLSAPQNQQCTENSTQAKGDEPGSHIASNIPILSGNGARNS